MNPNYLASLLTLFIVCVNGFPLRPGQSTRSGVTEHGAWVVGSQELRLGTSEIEKHQYHTESSKKKFFLNPAKIPHIIKAKKAHSNFDAHTENIRQLALAQNTGVVKVTRSKSGNKNHYEAVRF